jgi:hypothetical protein
MSNAVSRVYNEMLWLAVGGVLLCCGALGAYAVLGDELSSRFAWYIGLAGLVLGGSAAVQRKKARDSFAGGFIVVAVAGGFYFLLNAEQARSILIVCGLVLTVATLVIVEAGLYGVGKPVLTSRPAFNLTLGLVFGYASIAVMFFGFVLGALAEFS